MLERKPTFEEARIIRAILGRYVNTDADAEDIAEEANCEVEAVREFIRVAY